MTSCMKVCQQKCPTAPPHGPTVNGQLCESYGALASGTEAQKACDLTMVSGCTAWHSASRAVHAQHGTARQQGFPAQALLLTVITALAACIPAQRPCFPVIRSMQLATAAAVFHLCAHDPWWPHSLQLTHALHAGHAHSELIPALINLSCVRP
jgi:hypothetical protein